MANEETLQRVRDATESTDTTTTNIDAAQGNWPGIETGQDTVTTAGTAVQLNGGTSIAVPDGASVSVTALPNNAGNIYVGDDTVSASTGDILTADTSVAIPTTDVNNIYIDADNDGEGVSWIVEVEE